MATVDLRHGSIQRLPNGTHIVRAHGDPKITEDDTISCENPTAPVNQRIYRKHFQHKRIYLPHELSRARKEVLSLGQKDVIVLGMTGYSSISEADAQAWGMTLDSYLRGCEDIVANMYLALRREYPGIKVRIAEGASNMGIDLAVINASRALGIPHLGHSCPNYMMYVVDDDDAVIVSATRDEYSDDFIQSLHILCSVGGRLQALMHDIKAAIEWNKKVLLFDIMRTLSSNRGGPPARDADGKIQNATAAFLDAIKLYSNHSEMLSPYEELRSWVRQTVVREGRKLISADTAFSNWKREAASLKRS